jgi:hypothetical protein
MNRISNRTWFGVLLAVAFHLATVRHGQSDVILDVSNLPDTGIAFSNGGFSFSSGPSGYEFGITGITGNGVGDSIGLQGFFIGGPFSIGTIVQVGPSQEASVVGTSTLHISDGRGFDLTASVQWFDISTVGGAGALNLAGQYNITDIAYAGTNADLSAITADSFAVESITFQFAPPMTLSQLVTTGGSTSYSGTLFSEQYQPEPTSASSVGFAVASFLLVRRRARQGRQRP